MVEIENAWFRHQDCPGGNNENSDSLDLDSFKGLFLIAGVALASAFVMFLATFLYEHKNILASEDFISQKIAALATQFDREKDTSSRGSRQTYPSNGRITIRRDCDAAEYNTSDSPQRATDVSPHHDVRVFTQEESFPNSESSTTAQHLPAETEIPPEN